MRRNGKGVFDVLVRKLCVDLDCDLQVDLSYLRLFPFKQPQRKCRARTKATRSQPQPTMRQYGTAAKAIHRKIIRSPQHRRR